MGDTASAAASSVAGASGWHAGYSCSDVGTYLKSAAGAASATAIAAVTGTF